MPRLREATPEGCVPFTPMSNEPVSEAAVPPMNGKRGKSPLDAMNEDKLTSI